MKKYLLILTIVYSCSNNAQKVDTNGLKDTVQLKTIDSTYSKIYFENSKNIKETGLLIRKLKFGLWKEFNYAGDLVKATYYYYDTAQFKIDIAELDFKSINFNSHGLKLSIPKKFKEVELNQENILFALKKENCSPNNFCPNYTFSYQNTSNYVLKDSISLLIEKLNSKFEKFKVVSIEKLNLGEEAYKISFMASKINFSLGGIILIFKNNLKTFNLSYYGPNTKENEFIMQKAVIDEVIQSITFSD